MHDDGLPCDDVGHWASEKHGYLQRYIEISSAVRCKFVGPGKAGAAYIDLFSGWGRSQIRDTEEVIDGSAVCAWKASVASGAPFSKLLIADLDPVKRSAAACRLSALGAPVVELDGGAVEAVSQIEKHVHPLGLHFAFIDPYNIETCDFRLFSELAVFRRIDILAHVSKMDLQRNLLANIGEGKSIFDAFAPGWREAVNLEQSPTRIRHEIFRFWRDSVAGLGVWPSTEMKLITGSKNQPLYYLLVAARHKLALRFWQIAASDGQGSLF